MQCDVGTYSDRTSKTVCAHEGWNCSVTRTTGALQRLVGNFENNKSFIWTICARLAHSTSHQIQWGKHPIMNDGNHDCLRYCSSKTLFRRDARHA
jgi:hypothetical protein